MKTTGIVMAIVAAIAVLFLLRPSLIRMPLWRATVTPLASIIGSGFLIVGPILGHISGNWAWAAMLALCLTAYLFGSAIRWNIRVVEPMHAGQPPRPVAVLERASEFALTFAYFVSVAYYLNLFASFALRAEHIINPAMTRWTSSAVIVTLGVFGTLRGLRALENIEASAVGIKLGLITGLLTALVLWLIVTPHYGRLFQPDVPHETGMHGIRILLGLVILVQGFETSRYLGAAYDRPTRVRTMRYAQLLSSGIYLRACSGINDPFGGRGFGPGAGAEAAVVLAHHKAFATPPWPKAAPSCGSGEIGPLPRRSSLHMLRHVRPPRS